MSDRLADLLAGAVTPGVYLWTARTRAATIIGRAEAAGWRCFHLDGVGIADKSAFLSASARAMAFPPYFGNNWDALEDSLRDLTWAPAQRGYLVLLDGVARFADTRPAEFATALDILRSAVESWRDTATPMTVLLRGAGRIVTGVPRL